MIDEQVKRLNDFYQEYWEFTLSEYPTYATYLGDHRYDDKLEDFSAGHYQQRIARFREYLDEVKTIGKPETPADQLNFDLFKRELALQIEGAKYFPYLLPLTQQTGPHIDLPQLITYHPYKTVKDFQNYTERLKQVPRVFDQIIANLRSGIDRGLVQPRSVVEKIVPQLQVQVVESADKSEFHKPVDQIPGDLAWETREQVQGELDETIATLVSPSYAKLLDFVKDEYLPKSRQHPGIWSLPNGRAMYGYDIRYYTTTNLTPAQIHRIGKSELARINREIRAVLRKARFKGTLQQFNAKLREDKSNFYEKGEDLLDGFKRILDQMDAKLNLLFGRLPKAKYGFREIEKFRADAAPAAYYYPPPEDGSRPAYFYVNTYRPETRPKYTMEALAYHEAVPGHHLQLALQQELTDLPEFRRNGGYTAFVEGWAHYAERLGLEIGFYKDLLSQFGRLTQEAWRAARLVVDTGIHSMKWSRDRAINFLKQNTANSEQDIVSEVDRYIAWPGQALAYKLGDLKIRQLRSKAEKREGSSFDIRRFHDTLLSDGALPLDLLEKKMNAQRKGPRTKGRGRGP